MRVLKNEESWSVACVTGQMAAGKNFVCAKMAFENERICAIDLDSIVHEAIDRSRSEILAAFGETAKERGIALENADGSLNRRNLGALIFPDASLLKKQEDIVYPKTAEIVESLIEKSRADGKIVILNATVLFKIPRLMRRCEKIFFVKAPFLKRLVRAKRRDGLPLRHILSRFRAQRRLFFEYERTGIPIEIVRN